MLNSRTNTNLATAIVMGAVLTLGLFTVVTPKAHAESNTAGADIVAKAVLDGNVEIRQALMDKLAELRKQVEERRGAVMEQHNEQKAENQQERQESIAEIKVDFKAGLEGLSREEMKAALMERLDALRAQMAAKKAEMDAAHEENKEERAEVKSDFMERIKNLTPAERRVELVARLEDIKVKLDAKLASEAGDSDESEAISDTEDGEDVVDENADEADENSGE